MDHADLAAAVPGGGRPVALQVLAVLTLVAAHRSAHPAQRSAEAGKPSLRRANDDLVAAADLFDLDILRIGEALRDAHSL